MDTSLLRKRKYFIIPIALLLASCDSNRSDAEHDNVQNGNLDSTFFKDELKTDYTASDSARLSILFNDGWLPENNANGVLNSCYNFKPLYGNVENYLNIIVGGGTDVVIKLMDLKTDVCKRYVFVNSNSSFRIAKIPEGQYYLKIAYGKRWFSKISEGICIGKFTSNALYEKAEETLDFRLIQNQDGYSIPSYEVALDVVSSGVQNSLSSNEISEEEFNR